jgi:hypothetical protein
MRLINSNIKRFKLYMNDICVGTAGQASNRLTLMPTLLGYWRTRRKPAGPGPARAAAGRLPAAGRAAAGRVALKLASLAEIRIHCT